VPANSRQAAGFCYTVGPTAVWPPSGGRAQRIGRESGASSSCRLAEQHDEPAAGFAALSPAQVIVSVGQTRACSGTMNSTYRVGSDYCGLPWLLAGDRLS
jgi:hypothetical protein